MNDPFFNFPPSEARWPPGPAMTGMGQMGPQMPPGAAAAANHFSVPPPSLARQAGLGQSFGPGGGGSCGQLPTLPGLGNHPHSHQHQGALSHNGALSHVASTASMGYPSSASVGPYCESPMSAAAAAAAAAAGQMAVYGMHDMDDTWRGSSIASLRRKALEHTVSMTGMAAYR